MSKFLKKWLFSRFHTDLIESDVTRIHQQLFMPFPTFIEKAKELQNAREITTGRLTLEKSLAMTGIKPYWMAQQTDPHSPSYIPSQSLLINQTHRNWTTLSAPNCEAKAWVDPRGLLTPFPYGWSVDVWVSSGKTLVSAALQSSTQQTLSPENPVLTTTFSALNMQISLEHTLLGHGAKQGTVLMQMSVLNSSQTEKSFSVFLAIRPYNSLGLAPIHDVVYLSNNTLMVDHRLGVVLDQTPDNVVCLAKKDGDVSDAVLNSQMILQAECPEHLASGVVQYNRSLAPGETYHLTAKIPSGKQAPVRSFGDKLISDLSKQRLAKETDFLQKLDVPQEREAALAALVTAQDHLIAGIFTNPAIERVFNQQRLHIASHWTTPELESLRPFLPLVPSLNRAGRHGFTVSVLKHPKTAKLLQNALLNPSRDADVLALYAVAIWDTFQVTRDKSLLEAHAKIGLKIVKALTKSRIKSGSHKGLYKVSAGVDGIQKSDVYLLRCYEILAALKSIKLLFSTLGKSQDFLPFSHLEQDLSQALSRHLKDRAETENQEIRFGVSDTRMTESLSGTTLRAVYPLGLEKASDGKVFRTLQFLKRAYANSDGLLVELGADSGCHIARNGLIAHVQRLRQDGAAHAFIDWLTEISLDTGAFSTSVNLKTGGGSAGVGHDLEASLTYLDLIRECCLEEGEDDLHLFPFIPKSWVTGKGVLALDTIHTSFGEFSFHLEFQAHEATLTLKHAYHQKPKSLKLSFPFSLTKLSVDGIEKSVSDSLLSVPGHTQKITFEWSSAS